MNDIKKTVLLPVLAVLLAAALIWTGCGKSGQSGSRDVSGKTAADSGQKQDPGSLEESSGREPESGGLLSRGSGGVDQENGKNLPEEKNSPKKAPETVPENLHVGDVLSDGDLRITYMAGGIYEEENEYQPPETGYRYIFLRFCFENTSSDKELSIPLFSFACYADGYEAAGYYGGVNDLASYLPCGRITTGDLYFQVAEDAKNIEIEYRPKYIDRDALPPSGKVRFLYEGDQDSGYEPPVLTGRKQGACDVGGSAETKKERLTFLSCEADDSGSEYLNPAQGCTWYTLSFEITNIQLPGSEESDLELPVSAYDFSCYADGASCRAAYFRDDYLSADLDPGRRTKGTVTFEVPDKALVVEAEYRPADRSAGRIIFTVR